MTRQSHLLAGPGTLEVSPAPVRLLFIDLARATAVLFMIQGHVLHVTLGPDYPGGSLFHGWLYLRGLTSCAFLLLAGFSFSVATSRHWTEYGAFTPRLKRRLRRFAFFLVLGYAMRAPLGALFRPVPMTASEWHAFTAVDVLHVVAVTLSGMQALVWFTGTRRRFGMCAAALAAGVVLVTPFAWRADWTAVVPGWLAAYLSASTGSVFPVLPWAAYILFGAAAGMWFTRATEGCRAARASDSGRALVTLGAGMIAAGVLLNQVPLRPFGAVDFWTVSPNLFLVKAGSVLLLLAVAAWVTRWRGSIPRVVSLLSRESLAVYVAHVSILYGSLVKGILAPFGSSHHPGLVTVASFGLALIASMWLLAWLWHECKQRLAHAAAVPPALRGLLPSAR